MRFHRPFPAIARAVRLYIITFYAPCIRPDFPHINVIIGTGHSGREWSAAERIIYGDVLFLINFSMDFLTLCLTGKILRRSAKLSALTLAACFGAAYGVASVFLSGNAIIGLVIGAAVSALMCYTAFGRPILLTTAVFNITGLLLGGAVTAAYLALSNLRGAVDEMNIDALPKRIPFVWTAAIAAIFGAAAVVTARAAAKRRIAPEIEVEAEYDGRSITFSALTDSGNLLREPLGGSAVIVTSYATLEPLLPDVLRRLFSTGDTSLVAELPPEAMRRVRLIPARGASGSELFIGFLPDRVKAGRFDRADACLAVAAGAQAERKFGGAEAVAPALFG